MAFVRRAGALAPCAAGFIRSGSAPAGGELRINSIGTSSQFWTLAGRDPSTSWSIFLVELASRKGEADARKRMPAARARVLNIVEDWRPEGEGPFAAT